MTFADSLVWVLRAFGVLYLIGGVFAARQSWFWARLGPDMTKLARMMRDIGEEAGEPNEAAGDLIAGADHGRPWWVFTGSLLLIAAGAAMALGHASSVLLLSLIIVHQMLYFIRQRRLELRASTPEAAAEARPERSTVSGFFWALIVAALAAWLRWQGALWGSPWVL